MGLLAEAELEFGCEGAVKFQGDEAPGAGGQDVGDGAVAGADFDNGAAGEVAEGIGDTALGVCIDEKVLA